MRKSIIGISLILGIAGTASADSWNTSSDYDADDGYATRDSTDGWITAGIELPVVEQVVVQPRNGYVWIEGRWEWTGYEWQWLDGYWVRERPNYLYTQGRWEINRGRYRWLTGRWSPRPRTVVIRNYGNGWAHQGNWNQGNWNHGNWNHGNDHDGDDWNHGNHGNWNHGNGNGNGNGNHGNGNGNGNGNHGNGNGNGHHGNIPPVVVRPGAGGPRPGAWNHGPRGNVQVRDHRNNRGRGR